MNFDCLLIGGVFTIFVNKTKQLQRWLITILVRNGYIQVVDKSDNAFMFGRTKVIVALFVEPGREHVDEFI